MWSFPLWKRIICGNYLWQLFALRISWLGPSHVWLKILHNYNCLVTISFHCDISHYTNYRLLKYLMEMKMTVWKKCSLQIICYQPIVYIDWVWVLCTGKYLSEALILASTNPPYDKRVFTELRVPSSEHVENMLRTCCVLT